MTDPATLRSYIHHSTNDQAVRRDVAKLYDNFETRGAGILSPDILANARDRGHSAEVSRALQRIEVMAGNDNNFSGQVRADIFQHEYDAAAQQMNGRHRSADVDGRQDYKEDAAVSAADRVSKHPTHDAGNAAHASRYMQNVQDDAFLRGHRGSAIDVDGIQKAYERGQAIENTRLSQDPDRPFHPVVKDYYRNARKLQNWMFK